MAIITANNSLSISSTEGQLKRKTALINNGNSEINSNYSNQPYLHSSSLLESYQVDPDLLIKNYFSSSSEERYKSRKHIIEQIKDFKPFLAILSYGASGEYRDGYEGAINLLAETNDYTLLKEVSLRSLILYKSLLLERGINIAENFLEILITAIACAEKINVNDRFNLLVNIIPKINSRMIKASMIDALGLIADQMDLEAIKTEIKKYILDKDSYISSYAQEALEDLE
ncbi:hypothetical protein H6G11_10095 [Cyanobacterium aponinum FACHB-4101]|uniref:hypothetical protein n=1 Tax=Cyanobacterium aponinum TaxID=379064 RepID=UPI0016805036|nr:hypothetical protein [Cyanobacterium aponinum]MBD2394602.1 hypothetical protein [Cyanobacterium aponinum FACHB-4101]